MDTRIKSLRIKGTINSIKFPEFNRIEYHPSENPARGSNSPAPYKLCVWVPKIKQAFIKSAICQCKSCQSRSSRLKC